jgi:ornithine cyclodeaminase/alanine dehydrogenase-like protein (mu-crystallin family)
VARARLFVDSRAAAVKESGDVVMGVADGCFAWDHIVAELGEASARRETPDEVTIFKSLGLAVEDVVAANLALDRAKTRGVGVAI